MYMNHESQRFVQHSEALASNGREISVGTMAGFLYSSTEPEALCVVHRFQDDVASSGEKHSECYLHPIPNV